MSTLLLRLAAPMQAWGISSRFNRRTTNTEPTRSGIIGMIAAAMGFSREDSLGLFQPLKFGVRVDQPGTIQRDFQMVHREKDKGSKELTWVTDRYYIEDAVFLAALEGDKGLLDSIEEALQHPAYPLFLGRRSCPPTVPMFLCIREGNLKETLSQEKWQAAPWYQKKAIRKKIEFLEIVRDAEVGENGYTVRDVPESFSQRRRLYDFRNVVRESIPLADIYRLNGKDSSSEVPTQHDPMALLEDYHVSIKSQNK